MSEQDREKRTFVARFNNDIIYIENGKIYSSGRKISLETARMMEQNLRSYEAGMDFDRGPYTFEEAMKGRGLIQGEDGQWKLERYAIDRYLHMLSESERK